MLTACIMISILIQSTQSKQNKEQTNDAGDWSHVPNKWYSTFKLTSRKYSFMSSWFVWHIWTGVAVHVCVAPSVTKSLRKYLNNVNLDKWSSHLSRIFVVGWSQRNQKNKKKMERNEMEPWQARLHVNMMTAYWRRCHHKAINNRQKAISARTHRIEWNDDFIKFRQMSYKLRLDSLVDLSCFGYIVFRCRPHWSLILRFVANIASIEWDEDINLIATYSFWSKTLDSFKNSSRNWAETEKKHK